MKRSLFLGFVGVMVILLFCVWLTKSFWKTEPVMPVTINTEVPESDLSPNEKPVARTGNIPTDIHIGQVTETDNVEFVLVQRQSLNIFLPKVPANFPANFAGVLNWNGRDLKWEKAIRVEDTNPELSSKNNPVSLRFEGPIDTDQVPYLTVVDQNGAGSGEGIAKVLRPKTIDWKNWEVVECYYWSDGKKVDITPKLKLLSPQCQAVKVTAVFE